MGQQGGHVFGGIIRFQKGRLASHHRIGRAVALIEAVTREFFQEIEDPQRLGARDLVHLGAALHEGFPLLGHLLLFFLSHRPAQKIRLSQRVPRQQPRRRHHLLLVNQHPVGLGADFFQQGMLVGKLGFPLFPLHVLVNQVHGPGPVKGDQCDQVLDPLEIENRAGSPHSG